MTWYRKRDCPLCGKEMFLYDQTFKPKMKKDEKFAGKAYHKCGSCQKFFAFIDEGTFIWDITMGWLIFQNCFVFR